MMKRYLPFGVLQLIIAILLYFTPTHIAPVCQPAKDGSFMKCHWSGLGVSNMGLIIACLAIAFLLARHDAIRLGISKAQTIVGLFVIMLPTTVIGTCANHNMPCNVAAKPTIILLASIYIVINLVYMYLNRNMLRGEK